MKIERIEVTNFLGLRHLAVDVDAPVLLVCGPNGAGKSSLIEAIRFALTGETPRAALKKDYPTLLSAGQTAGIVSIVADGQKITRNVKTGSGTGAPDDLGALAYTLDAPRLARMDAKERRAALFGLMGVSFSSAVVAQELIERGHMADHVERIKPYLKGGFDAAAAEAKKLAAEARGAWKEVTGETYGAVKAETWAAPIPSRPRYDADDVAAHRAAYEVAVAQVAALESRKSAAEQAAISEQRLRERAAKIGALRDDLAKLEAVQAEHSPEQTPIGDCPECGASLALAGKSIVKAIPIDESKPRITDAAIETSLGKTRRELRDAEQAQAALDELAERKIPKSPDDSEIREAREAVETCRARLAEAEAARRAYEEAKRAAQNAATATARAEELNSRVAAWTAMEMALSPSGLPAELLARALAPLNKALDRVHTESNWPRVRVEDDIAITADGRAYGLLSESERWRTDTALAYAAAEVSGCGLVLLDRFDVLDVRSRSQFIRLALAMDAQTIAAGTLKESPGSMPGKLQAVWLGG